MPIASLSDIWSAALERFAWLRGLFGAPFAFLNARESLTPEERGQVLAYLRPLERLIRCALVLLALAEPPRPRLVRKRAHKRSAPPPSPPAPTAPSPDSSAWRDVRFHVLPRTTPSWSRRRATSAPACGDRYPLARRMEAIARVMANPERWIRRLAEWLRTRMNAARAALRPLLTPDPNAPPDLADARVALEHALDTS